MEIYVKKGDGDYIWGEEKDMIERIEGKKGKKRIKNKLKENMGI